MAGPTSSNSDQTQGSSAAAEMLLKLLPRSTTGLGATVVLVVGVLCVLVKLGVSSHSLAVQMIVWGLAAAVVVLIMAAIASTIHARGRSRQPRGEPYGGHSMPPLLQSNGFTVIGLHLGRQNIQCGALRFPSSARHPGGTSLVSVARAGGTGYEIAHYVDTNYDGSAAFERAVDLFLETVNELETKWPESLPVVGLGIAMPGVLDPRRRLVRFSAGAMNAGTGVADEFVECLIERTGKAHTCRIFGQPEGEDSSQITRQIQIENDATAVARAWVLQHRDVSDCACLLVGEGVGAGLVVGGRLLYGGRFSAGEVGHQVMELSDSFSNYDTRLDEAQADIWTRWVRGRQSRHCLCGRTGRHWEMVSNGDALVELFQMLDGDLCRNLIDCLAGNSSLMLDHFERANEILKKPRPPEVLADLKERLDSVTMEAARLFAVPLAIGISNLINVLDLGQVVLLGRIPALLKERLQVYVPPIVRQRTLSGDVNLVFHGRAKEIAWRGAAQIFVDPTYVEGARLREMALPGGVESPSKGSKKAFQGEVNQGR
ncbi:MAG TPA: ROK family protein [Mycobacteriales bacterium]|nr:ROK family protein [Mycobacteriales bacterium]